MACRVVCGRLEVIATFCPISAFVSVDLPAFGPADEAGEAGAEALGHLAEGHAASSLGLVGSVPKRPAFNGELASLLTGAPASRP